MCVLIYYVCCCQLESSLSKSDRKTVMPKVKSEAMMRRQENVSSAACYSVYRCVCSFIIGSSAYWCVYSFIIGWYTPVHTLVGGAPYNKITHTHW